MPTVGLLYPGYSAEDDYADLERRLAREVPELDLALPLQHTSVGEDAHRVDALLDLGGHERLSEGAHALVRGRSVDSVVWACTSGSFVFGREGAQQQVAEITRETGLPASSTSLAFVHACQDLGLTRVAVAASYPEDVAEHLVAFLEGGGITVTSMCSHDILTAAEVGTLQLDDVVALVRSVDVSGAEAVLVPDTAMHSLAWIDDLEARMGMPVLTANQVTVYEGLRLLGDVPPIPGLGTLFAKGHPT